MPRQAVHACRSNHRQEWQIIKAAKAWLQNPQNSAEDLCGAVPRLANAGTLRVRLVIHQNARIFDGLSQILIL